MREAPVEPGLLEDSIERLGGGFSRRGVPGESEQDVPVPSEAG